MITITDLIFRVLLNLKKSRFIILYYHSVPIEKIERFKWQLYCLQKFGQCVSSDFILSVVDNRRYYAITFDDGFTSVLDNALPEMEKKIVPCTIFIPTNYIGKNPNWHIKGEIFDSNEKIMNEHQIKSLNNSLVKIGSHSLNHPDLTKIASNEQEKELIASKKYLEDLLNTEIYLFSFPYGSYNPKLIEIATSAGYRFIFSTEPSFSSQFSEQNSSFRGRVPVDTLDFKFEFLLKILGGYNWVSSYISFKKKMKSVKLK
jgi:peptidoglycan/xylan/chitin deacetylase (PgdA/CDA1 family)